jgi:hypothetical protein
MDENVFIVKFLQEWISHQPEPYQYLEEVQVANTD